MVFMGRVGLFTLYISDPPGQVFRRGPSKPRGKPCRPRGTGEDPGWTELFCVVLLPSGREWKEVVESGSKW